MSFFDLSQFSLSPQVWHPSCRSEQATVLVQSGRRDGPGFPPCGSVNPGPAKRSAFFFFPLCSLPGGLAAGPLLLGAFGDGGRVSGNGRPPLSAAPGADFLSKNDTAFRSFNRPLFVLRDRLSTNERGAVGCDPRRLASPRLAPVLAERPTDDGRVRNEASKSRSGLSSSTVSSTAANNEKESRVVPVPRISGGRRKKTTTRRRSNGRKSPMSTIIAVSRGEDTIAWRGRTPAPRRLWRLPEETHTGKLREETVETAIQLSRLPIRPASCLYQDCIKELYQGAPMEMELASLGPYKNHRPCHSAHVYEIPSRYCSI